jgi:hypothetical protein
MKIVLTYLFFAMLVTVSYSQPSVYCDYRNAWKIESIESPPDSPYLELLECNFFICEDGHTGCYISDAREATCQCCWKRKGDIFVVSKSSKKVKYRVQLWNEEAIILTPVDEKGTIIVLRKD